MLELHNIFTVFNFNNVLATSATYNFTGVIDTIAGIIMFCAFYSLHVNARWIFVAVLLVTIVANVMVVTKSNSVFLFKKLMAERFAIDYFTMYFCFHYHFSRVVDAINCLSIAIVTFMLIFINSVDVLILAIAVKSFA